MGRYREYHAHFERLAFLDKFIHHRLQIICLDRVYGFAVLVRHMRFHLFPDAIGNSNGVTIQVHAKRGNDIRLGTKTNGCTQRLTGQHMRTVEFAINDTIQQHLPVGLRLQCDIQTLVLEITFLVGNRQWRHVCQFDKSEFQFLLLQLPRNGCCRGTGHETKYRSRHHKLH